MTMRRRRLTIAALVLLVLGGGLWWSTRPRIDPRLVGTWKLVTRIAEFGGEVTYKFGSDGRGTATTSVPYTDHFTWHSDGRRLYVGIYDDFGPGSLAAARLAALPGGQHLLPRVPPLEFEEFIIFRLDGDELTMSDTTPGLYSDADVPKERSAEFRRVQRPHPRMTYPPSPQKRHRRRIVVVTITVLVLGLAWWFRPRVDQRFVGTRTISDLSIAPNSRELVFYPDGTSRNRIVAPNGQLIEVQRWRWTLRSDIVEFRHVRHASSAFLAFIEEAVRRFAIPDPAAKFQVTGVTPNQISLRAITPLAGFPAEDLELLRRNP